MPCGILDESLDHLANISIKSNRLNIWLIRDKETDHIIIIWRLGIAAPAFGAPRNGGV